MSSYGWGPWKRNSLLARAIADIYKSQSSRFTFQLQHNWFVDSETRFASIPQECADGTTNRTTSNKGGGRIRFSTSAAGRDEPIQHAGHYVRIRQSRWRYNVKVVELGVSVTIDVHELGSGRE